MFCGQRKFSETINRDLTNSAIAAMTQVVKKKDFWTRNSFVDTHTAIITPSLEKIRVNTI